MSLTNDQIIEAISSKSVMEIVDLVKAMEEKFGVTAAQAVVAAGPASGGAASVAEPVKDSFNVMLLKSGDNKVGLIKVVKELTGLGLKEAKDLVDGAPKIIKENLPKKDAEEVAKKLTDAGAQVELK
ncbi:MAG: 50S ribosomal protein L7/L12 [Methylacidiphilales bacterium]|nr:50S ribosomal protein L7/L12 [Candidatus Methylacidiphilales bacterium]